MKKFFSNLNMFLFVLFPLILLIPFSKISALKYHQIGNFIYCIIDKKLYISGYTGTNSKVEIPDRLLTFSVYGIYDSAFRDNKNITSVTIPSCVKTIGLSAFEGCSVLESVEFSSSSSISYIDSLAFSGCNKLESIVIPSNVNYISYDAFNECNNLKNIYVLSKEIKNIFNRKNKFPKFATYYIYEGGDIKFIPDGAVTKYLLEPPKNTTFTFTVGSTKQYILDFINKNSLPTSNGSKIIGTWTLSGSIDTSIAHISAINLTFEPNDSKYSKLTKNFYIKFVGSLNVMNTYYSDADGFTSVKVNGNKRFWIKEESDGSYAWYGIDNNNEIFDDGTIIKVRWVNNKENPVEFAQYWKMLDENVKNKAEKNKIWIFDIIAIKPDGTMYKDFGGKLCNLYIQLGKDWDSKDIQAYYISSGFDEQISLNSLSPVYVPKIGNCMILQLKHFSPYVYFDVYDSYGDYLYENTSNVLNSSNIKTGRLREPLFCSLFFISLFILSSKKKKYDNS